ncbi:hypothetical protein GF371_05110 [Candidatus Woesearchaeota archaeon]|nr:hypothetical protein [Candidatus Woesearchaeota archaeon]
MEKTKKRGKRKVKINRSKKKTKRINKKNSKKTFLYSIKNTNYIKSFLDQRLLLKCAGFDLAFFFVGIVGILNLTIFLIALTVKTPFKMMQLFFEVQKSKGSAAAIEVLENLGSSNTMLTTLILTIMLAILGFVIFMLALSFFKGLIYNSLAAKKITKKYVLRFTIFNIAYYLIILALVFGMFKLFNITTAVKLSFAVAVLYLYFTPFFRIRFTGKHIISELKRAVQDALCFATFLRVVLMVLTFFILFLLLVLIFPTIILAFIVVPIFYYLSAWSRSYLFITVKGAEK